jgi:hypothetical protein
MPIDPIQPESPFSADLVKIEFLVNLEDPNLLIGLESLVSLGLLSDRRMREIALKSLVCKRPIALQAAPSTAPPTAKVKPQKTPALAIPALAVDVAPSVLSNFMAEISVVWLLFLGVFLLVVSSAAMAAAQWRNFNAIGQYGILLLYTLAFGGAGLWASQQDKLKLTGRMLQMATLLIIPVNFWMMDGFRLWNSPIGLMTIGIATVLLSALQWKLLAGTSKRQRWNSFLLNGLHWGWTIAIVPVLFTYIGTVVTVFVQAIAQRSRNTQEAAAHRSLPSITIGFATLLLVGRAILVKGVPVSRFGLAIALIGGLIYWIYRQRLGFGAGLSLIGLGWLVSVIPDTALINSGFDPLWQTLGVSGLAIAILGHRLHQAWEKPVLVGFWLVGLQSYTLLRVLIPPAARKTVMNAIADAAGLRSGAWELTGLGFFSYVILSLGLAIYLRRRQQTGLARLTEQLALGLGAVLIIPSVFSPLVRAVYFSLAALTLSLMWLRRRSGSLVYLAHTTTAIAVISWILWVFPQLSTQQWAIILLVGTLGEWGLAAISRDRFWQRSAWFLGLAQATCAYPLLWNDLSMKNPDMGQPWLIVPIALTALAYMPNFGPATTAAWLSVGSLFLALPMGLLGLNPFLVALLVATGVMFANTAKLRQFTLAGITLGYGLLGVGLESWQLLGKPEPRWWLVGVAIALWLVWLLRDLLVRWATHQDSEERSLPHLYYVAANGWGRGLAVAIGMILGTIVLVGFAVPGMMWAWPELLFAGTLSAIAIGYRVYQEPSDLGLWGLAIGAEILVNLAAEWIKAPLDYRVIVTLILGMGTQLIGELWLRRRGESRWSVLHGAPISYATLSFLLAHTTFSSLTGLYTIAVALIFMMVGRRSAGLQALSYFGLVGLSIGAYESLIYWLSQSHGGRFGDGVTAVALVSALLALLYQVAGDRLAGLLRVGTRGLKIFSDLHWGLGTFCAIVAMPAGLSMMGEWLWILSCGALALNALLQGRRAAVWIYPGFWQMVFTGGFLLHKLLPGTFFVQWAAVIASIVAYGVFSTDWEALGWAGKPWSRSATALPITIALLTAGTINPPCLLATAAFYGVDAWKTDRVRLSYFGVFLAIWGLFQWLVELGVSEPLWYAAILSLAALLVIEIEPKLQVNSAKGSRHLLRCFALGLFSVTLFYDPWNSAWLRGVITIGLSFVMVLIGLVRRTRAYLYVGTTTFMLGVLRMLWLFIADYSLLLWAVGIVLGLMIIWVAATFESRRSQTIAFVEYWLSELAAWE